jgi:hypothetical protein
MNNDHGSRTNALEYSDVYAGGPLRISVALRLRSALRSLRRRFRAMDDFDWSDYPSHYRVENAFNRRYFTDDLRDVDFLFDGGRLYLLADCKPLNPTHRCILEAICNLPGVRSIAEIGVGGGRYVANLRAILGRDVQFAGYDLSPGQLKFFSELFPEVFAETKTGVMDLVQTAVPAADRPDVAFASTVLMHIQRPDAYQSAFANLLASGKSYVVIMDNWRSHDYFRDLQEWLKANPGSRLYAFDSGANLAIVVAHEGRSLGAPYFPLASAGQLQKYMSAHS